MGKIVAADYAIQSFALPRDEAIAFMEERNQPYKVELIQDLPEDAVITFYKQGEFVDLCAGPHLSSTGQVKAFKLLQAGRLLAGQRKTKCSSGSTASFPRRANSMSTWLS